MADAAAVPLRCSYFGLASGAIALRRAGHGVTTAVLGRRPEPGEAAELRRTLGASCPILVRPELAVPSVEGLLATAGAQLGVCYLYPRLLPERVLRAFPLGVVSYHPSLLPRHRGADPYFWTIWSGDEHAGVTVLRLDAGVDTGPVLEQRRLAVGADETGGALAVRLDALGLSALLDVVDEWASGGPRDGEPQAGGAATAAPAPDEDLLALRLDWPAGRLERLVRAASPDPGAVLTLGDGEPLVVLAARETRLLRPGALRPGDVVRLDAGVVVWTGDGGLALEAVQREGESPRREAATIAALFPGIADLRPLRRG